MKAGFELGCRHCSDALLIANTLMDNDHDYIFADNGLRIEGVSAEVGHAIKSSVFAFRNFHQLSASAWHVRVYGLTDGVSMDVWIGRGSSPSFRFPYTLAQSIEAGEKIRSLLEGLLHPP